MDNEFEKIFQVTNSHMKIFMSNELKNPSTIQCKNLLATLNTLLSGDKCENKYIKCICFIDRLSW